MSQSIASIKKEYLLPHPLKKEKSEVILSTSNSSEPHPLKEEKSEAILSTSNSSEPHPLTEEKSEVILSTSNSSEPPLKKFKAGKKKGQNRNRPKPFRLPNAEKLCRSYWQGIPSSDKSQCPFSDCRFSHDVKSYIEKKATDIGDKCYNYETFGMCRMGITCRFGASHIDFDKCISKVNEEELTRSGKTSTVTNSLIKEVQNDLWKKKYNFSKSDAVVKQAIASCVKATPNGTCPQSSELTDDSDVIKLRPLEKKEINWKDKLYLAPLTTLGNLPFRRVCKTFGADITCGEMAVSLNLLNGSSSEWALVKRHSSEDCFGVQLCGNNVSLMTKCAQLIQEQTEVDFIDINMGCPIELIYTGGSGAALMRRKLVLKQMVYGMNRVLRVPLTLKMRTGIFSKQNVAHEIISEAKHWDVGLVTVHGRSREQRYVKKANWDYINQCAKIASPMPLFGSGDVLTYEEYKQKRESTDVAGIMVGRGALIKPWLFTEIKEQREWDISSTERFGILKNFVNNGLEHWGSDVEGIEKTRRFLLEWLSFLHRYIPIGLLERPQEMNLRPEPFKGRDDLETLMASSNVKDWIEISEMLLGKVPDNFQFLPKHRANSWTHATPSLTEFYD